MLEKILISKQVDDEYWKKSIATIDIYDFSIKSWSNYWTKIVREKCWTPKVPKFFQEICINFNIEHYDYLHKLISTCQKKPFHLSCHV